MIVITCLPDTRPTPVRGQMTGTLAMKLCEKIGPLPRSEARWVSQPSQPPTLFKHSFGVPCYNDYCAGSTRNLKRGLRQSSAEKYAHRSPRGETSWSNRSQRARWYRW